MNHVGLDPLTYHLVRLTLSITDEDRMLYSVKQLEITKNDRLQHLKANTQIFNKLKGKHLKISTLSSTWVIILQHTSLPNIDLDK